MKYHLITYGCQMNLADAEEMSQPLESRGLTRTAELADADVVIMNTCTVREHAEQRARSQIGRLEDWRAANPDRIFIVAGCAATLWGDKLRKRFPQVDAVSPATQIEDFPELIDNILKDRWNGLKESSLAGPIPDVLERTALAPGVETPWFGSDATGYVTTMRGCNYSCAYCIVPTVRGREKYRPMPDILEDVRRFVSAGKTEIMLLGQTVNSYYYRAGVDSSAEDFSSLLRAVSAVPGVGCIRFMSPHPRHMRENLFRTIAEVPTIARHVHLPVQSGSTRMLEQMNRLYTRDQYITIAERLRAIPGMKLTTDIIVGFPGETEEDFAETLSLMEKVRFNGVFVFQYSQRPGTVSAGMPDDVTEDEKLRRLQRVLALNDHLLQSPALSS